MDEILAFFRQNPWILGSGGLAALAVALLNRKKSGGAPPPAASGGASIHISGGHVGGDVVGRDKITARGGDYVGGDKISAGRDVKMNNGGGNMGLLIFGIILLGLAAILMFSGRSQTLNVGPGGVAVGADRGSSVTITTVPAPAAPAGGN